MRTKNQVLHFHDLLNPLLFSISCDHGNTIVIIEHNLDVIKTADWLIDAGYAAWGDGGGEVVAIGTQNKLLLMKKSHRTSSPKTTVIHLTHFHAISLEIALPPSDKSDHFSKTNLF